MADLKFTEKDTKLELAIIESGIVETEATILAKNLKAVQEITKIKVTTLVEELTARGVSEAGIIAILQNDLANKGPIFGPVLTQSISNSVGMSSNVQNTAEKEYYDYFGYIKEPYVWVAVFINTCPDCIPRHGEIHPYSYWESVGLPASGFSVCGNNCKCKIIPQSIAEDNKSSIDVPVKRERSALLKDAKKLKKDGKIKNVSNYVTRKLGEINA